MIICSLSISNIFNFHPCWYQTPSPLKYPIPQKSHLANYLLKEMINISIEERACVVGLSRILWNKKHKLHKFNRNQRVLVSWLWQNCCSVLYFVFVVVVAFSPVQGFLENVQLFIPCLHFFSSFFLSGDKLAHTNFTLYARNSPQQAEMTVAKCTMTSCLWARFQIDSHGLDSSIVSPFRLGWIKGVWVLRCNLPPALMAESLGSFTCYCGNKEMEQTPNKSQNTKLTLEKKILPPLLPGFELATFESWLWRFYQ